MSHVRAPSRKTAGGGPGPGLDQTASFVRQLYGQDFGLRAGSADNHPPFRFAETEIRAREAQALQDLATAYEQMRAEIGKVIVGQREIVDEILIALFCRGHCLLVGWPGLAKTLLVSTIAEII